MSLKKKTVVEDTEAAKSLAPNSGPAEGRAQMMANVVNTMGQMANDDLVKFFELVQAQFENGGASAAAPDAAAQNAASIATRGAVQEDIETIFGGDEVMTEEFKEKVTTLFEAALETRVGIERELMKEEFDAKLDEEIKQVSERVVDNVDEYLNYVAEQWLKDNKVAIHGSLKTEITESFISELGSLCKKFNLNLPESDVPVVEELTKKIEKLEGKLNESEKLNVKLHEAASKLEKEVVVTESLSGLTPLQTDKMKRLVETIEFDNDVESFKRKVSILRENYFKDKPQGNVKLIDEEIAYEEDAKVEFQDPIVAAAHDLIQRTAKR